MPSKKGRISEGDLLIPTLIELTTSPTGSLPTSKLIEKLIVAMKPSGEDAEILDGRQDSKFSQIVRNMISHKESPGNIIHEGYAVRIPNGLKITDNGRAYLSKKGY